jgi:hypothetical protein
MKGGDPIPYPVKAARCNRFNKGYYIAHYLLKYLIRATIVAVK